MPELLRRPGETDEGSEQLACPQTPRQRSVPSSIWSALCRRVYPVLFGRLSAPAFRGIVCPTLALSALPSSNRCGAGPRSGGLARGARSSQIF